MAPQDDLTAERAAIALLEQMGLYGHPAASQFIGDILAALKTARQEALREARETVLAEILEDIPDNEADESYNLAIGHAAHALDRLASEGAPAPIDLLPKLKDDGSYGEHF